MAIFDGVISPSITVSFDTAGLGPIPATTSVWAPVPNADVRAISIRRGKSQENQSVQPGTMTLTLSNQSGVYDPEKLAAPWTISVYSQTVSLLSARMGVRVTAVWDGVTYTLYQGYMESLSLDYGINPTATLTFVDGLSYIAQQQLEPLLIPVGNNDTVRERVARIANQEIIAGTPLWPTSLRNLSSAVNTALYATTFDGDALSLMQTAAQCHPGARLFIATNGKLTLMEDDGGINTGLILSDSQASGTVGYDMIEVDPGSKYLLNQVYINKIDGQGRNRGTVTDQDAVSIARYGISSATYDLPLPTAQPLATYLAYEYSTPIDRVRRISFPAMGLGNQFPKVLISDLGEYCVVERETMDGRSLSWNCQIEGIEHDITPEEWRMGFITSVEATIPAPPPGPEPSNNGDPIPPSPPTGLTGTTAAYIDFREPRARVALTWTAPTTNADGSELTDLRWYEVQFKLSSASAWEFGGISYTNALTLSNLTVATGYDFRVFAVDSSNNKSAASNTFTITTANVTTFVGATPSTPVTASSLSTMTVTWDGKNNGGGAMPADFAFLEVHMSTVSGFTPTAATYKARFTGADYTVITNLTYGTTYYVKFVAYNQSGVASGASAQASGTARQLVDADIIANTISGAKIADGTLTASDKIIGNTITGALIQGLAITGDKIAGNTISGDKITADAIDGKIITGSVIQTSADASNQVVFNTTGLRMVSGGATKVQILANGTASFEGAVTATSGSFTGSVTSSSGTIGGFTISGTGLSSSAVSLFASGGTGVSTSGSIVAASTSVSGNVAAGSMTTTSGPNLFGGSENSLRGSVRVVDITSATGAYNVVQDVNGYLRQGAAIPSASKYKHDIVALADVPELDPSGLLDIPVRAFKYNENIEYPGRDRHDMFLPGFVAEEVDAHYPVAVDYDTATQDIEGVEYRYLLPGMLALIQRQSAQITALEARIEALEAKA